MPNNLGLDPFPDPVGHFGAPWRPFWILQAVRRCRRWASAPGAARLVFNYISHFALSWFISVSSWCISVHLGESWSISDNMRPTFFLTWIVFGSKIFWTQFFLTKTSITTTTTLMGFDAIEIILVFEIYEQFNWSTCFKSYELQYHLPTQALSIPAWGGCHRRFRFFLWLPLGHQEASGVCRRGWGNRQTDGQTNGHSYLTIDDYRISNYT